MARKPRRPLYGWDGARVRALRRHLGATQEELAAELNVRQQTVSEWETGQYRPRGASERLLALVAERAQFAYGRQLGEEDNRREEGRESQPTKKGRPGNLGASRRASANGLV